MSTTYNIIYSPQAFLDLSELYEYIRFTLQVPKTAEKQVSRIRKTIRSLKHYAYAPSACRVGAVAFYGNTQGSHR